MSVLARQQINGSLVRITRPAVVRQADGSRSRVGLVNGTAPDAQVLQQGARVRIGSLTVERRTSVFGPQSRATDTIRVPLSWQLDQDDQIEVLSGAYAGRRFRIETVLAYRGRQRITHAECAIVALPQGAK